MDVFPKESQYKNPEQPDYQKKPKMTTVECLHARPPLANVTGHFAARAFRPQVISPQLLSPLF